MEILTALLFSRILWFKHVALVSLFPKAEWHPFPVWVFNEATVHLRKFRMHDLLEVLGSYSTLAFSMALDLEIQTCASTWCVYVQCSMFFFLFLNVCGVTLAVDVVYHLWSQAVSTTLVDFEEPPTWFTDHEDVLEDIQDFKGWYKTQSRQAGCDDQSKS